MVDVIACLGLLVFVLGLGAALLHSGRRAGDRPGETIIAAADVDRAAAAIRFVVHNPGSQAVLVGASVGHRSLRLLSEGGQYVSVPRRTYRDKLLPGNGTVLCAVAAGERRMIEVPFGPSARRRAELAVTTGEATRLRVIHRAVELGRRPKAQPRARSADVILWAGTS